MTGNICVYVNPPQTQFLTLRFRLQILSRRTRFRFRVLDTVIYRWCIRLSLRVRIKAAFRLQGYEPTSMRAIRARYDPYEQSKGRVEQLRALGHSVDKVEFIVMGGTFMSLPESYRSHFITQLHNSLSGFNGNDIDEAVRFAEQAKTKCIGITIETRPDYCLKPHLSFVLPFFLLLSLTHICIGADPC